MMDKCGKNIVSCTNSKHMDEMIVNSPQWFSGVDNNPSIYRVYSENAESVREFEAFENDNSEHLKLLFCIDMLNEGIHINNIDGVILFCPTVSPVVYKQQIGRALSVGTNKKTVIFDVINNFENLYSIGSIEKEMRQAIEYINYLGEPDEIEVDEFDILGEARDFVGVLDRLDEPLTATWDEMYSYAEKYYKNHGHLNVPREFTVENGLSLGRWVISQRSIYNGTSYGMLTEERIDRLNRLNIIW